MVWLVDARLVTKLQGDCVMNFLHELSRKLLGIVCVAALSAIATPASAAQDAAWPNKPIRLLVGFPGGSTPDMAARAVAPKLSDQLKVPVVVENRPGASGNIATDQVAKATDNHTIGVVINGNLTSAKMLYPQLPYDPENDFSYISLVGTAPLVLLANTDFPTGKAFFEKAAQGGDKLDYGSVGNGSVGHLGLALLAEQVKGMNPVHVPYQGNPQVITALISKEIDMALIPPGIAMPQIEAGRVKAIGITTQEPSELTGNLPPLTEAGIADYTLEVWTAVVGPKSLPEADQKKLVEAFQTVLRDPEVRKQLVSSGWQAPSEVSSSGLQERIARETQQMKRIIETQGIKLE